MRLALLSIRGALASDDEVTSELVTRELRRSETWSRYQIQEVLEEIDGPHIMDDVKTNGFIDPLALSRQLNPGEQGLPTMTENERKAASGHTRNLNRTAQGVCYGLSPYVGSGQ